MSKTYRYGFPVFSGLVMGTLFLSGNIYLQAFIIVFIFWAIMEIAGRLNES